MSLGEDEDNGRSYDDKTIFHNASDTHYVGMNLQLHYVSNIDTVKEQFDLGMYINYEWKPCKEEVLDFQKLKREGREKDFTPIYRPSFRFPNMMNTVQREMKPYLDGSVYSLIEHGKEDTRGAFVSLPDDKKYLITARMAVRGTFAELLDLKNFPFDCQDLRVIVASTATSSKQILVPHFRRKTFVTVDQNFADLPEWNHHPPICDFVLSDKSRSARNYQFSSMILSLKVSRQYMSHIQRIVSLNFFITACQFSIFTIEPEKESLSDRLSISFTLVLTALVFMFVVEGRLPNVPFLTLLDTYIYSSFYLMMFMTLGSVIVIIMLTDDEERVKWNRFTFYCSFFLFALLQVWFALASKLRRRKEKLKLGLSSFSNFETDNAPQLQISSCIPSDQEGRKDLSIIYNEFERSYRGNIIENSFHYTKCE